MDRRLPALAPLSGRAGATTSDLIAARQQLSIDLDAEVARSFAPALAEMHLSEGGRSWKRPALSETQPPDARRRRRERPHLCSPSSVPERTVGTHPRRRARRRARAAPHCWGELASVLVPPRLRCYLTSDQGHRFVADLAGRGTLLTDPPPPYPAVSRDPDHGLLVALPSSSCQRARAPAGPRRSADRGYVSGSTSCSWLSARRTRLMVTVPS